MERRTIRQWRTAASLTRHQLADAMGVSHMSIYHWESGRTEPSARQLKALSEVFGVPMEAFAFEEGVLLAQIERQ